MKNTPTNKSLLVVAVLAGIIVLFSIVGIVNYANALKELHAHYENIYGWSLVFRSAFVLVAQGVSAATALFFILRGSTLAAHNSSGIFLLIIVTAFLMRVEHLLQASAWQVIFGVVWFSFLAWLLWRILPNTSLNLDAAKRRAT